jgi:hypothetical protein
LSFLQTRLDQDRLQIFCTISDEFELLLRQLNIYLDSEQIVKVFEEANVDKAGEADAQIDVDYHRGTIL